MSVPLAYPHHLAITPKLKPYKVQDLVFSCLRSKVAYDPPDKVRGILKKDGDKNVMGYHLIKQYNEDIHTKVDKIINDVMEDMQGPAIFYDAMTNIENTRDAQGFMLWKKNTIYVTFRGLHDTYDVFDAFNIRPRKMKDGIVVHAGFADQFFSLEPHITKDIRNIVSCYPIERIVFAGHSMGGSMAALAAAFYGMMYWNIHITCHTLGAPMVGNINFVKWFAKSVDECIRMEIEEDIVPLLPINDGFVHIPNGVRLMTDGNIENYYKSTLLTYSDLFNQVVLKRDLAKVAENHLCERYIERLLSLNHMRQCVATMNTIGVTISSCPQQSHLFGADIPIE